MSLDLNYIKFLIYIINDFSELLFNLEKYFSHLAV